MGTGGLFLRKLRARVTDEPTGFVWVEREKLAASGYPSSRRQLEWLMAQGINSILTLTREPLPKAWTDGLGIELGHVPMDDHAPPDAASLESGAKFVQDRVNAGKTVLVHCLAGQGRTGCVLAAYLILDRRMVAADALKSLRQIKPEFVEFAQEKAVYSFKPLTS